MILSSRLKIGDIVEIPVKDGFAYAQFTHRHAQRGELIRIIQGVFDTRPENFSQLVLNQKQFIAFFPLRLAVKEGLVSIVANVPVPEHDKPFPLFRIEGEIEANGRVLDWWLWDGRKEWKIGKLQEEHQSLPIDGIWGFSILVEAIESGWTVEQRA